MSFKEQRRPESADMVDSIETISRECRRSDFANTKPGKVTTS